MKRFLILFLLFFGTAYGQYYPSKTYSIDDGLPHSQVYMINSDSKGYIWCSTADGIAVFNGNEFNVLDSKTTSKLTDFLLVNDTTHIVSSTDKTESKFYKYSHYGDSLEYLLSMKSLDFYPQTVTDTNLVFVYGQDKIYFFSSSKLDSLKVKGLSSLKNFAGDFLSDDRFLLLDFQDAEYFYFTYQDTLKKVKAGKDVYDFWYDRIADNLYWTSAEGEFNYYHSLNRDYSKIIKSGEIKSSKIKEYKFDSFTFIKDPVMNNERGYYAAGVSKNEHKLLLVMDNLETPEFDLYVKEVEIPGYNQSTMVRMIKSFKNDTVIAFLTYFQFVVYHIDRNEFEVYNKENLFSFYDINDYTIDKDGHFWFATNGSGIKMLLSNGIQVYNDDGPNVFNLSYPNLSIQKVIEGDDNYFWATSDQGVYQIHPAFGLYKIFNDSNGLDVISTWGIAEYNKEIIVGTKLMKVFKKEDKNFKEIELKGVPDSIRYIRTSQDIAAFLEDSRGRLFFDYKENYFIVYEPGKNYKAYNMTDLLGKHNSFSYIYQFHEFKNKIYIAADNLGLIELDIDNLNNAKLYDSTDGLLSNDIVCITDYKNELWVGSYYHGLYKFDTRTSEFIKNIKPLANGKKYTNIKAMMTDDIGNLWIGTNNGILRYDGNEFNVFTQEYGIASNECRTCGISKRKNGDLLFGSANGFTNIQPSLSEPKKKSPAISFKAIKAGNKILPLKGKLELKYNQNNLYFEYDGIEFLAPEKIKYRIRLENFADDWIERKNNFTEYNNLNPGDYAFYVQAIDNFGNKSKILSYKFDIMPPFWKTIWFRILLLILSMGIIYLILRYKTASLRRSNISLERKVRKRTVELEKANTELRLSYEEIERTYAQLKETHKELKEANKLLQIMAVQDELTKAFNRRFFMKELEEQIKFSLKNKKPFGLLILDIDNFKKFNDSYGHLIGDKVLARVSSKASLVLRGFDIFARYGGEEFVAILPETNLAQSLLVAERVRKGIDEMVIHDDVNGSLRVTVSIGVTYFHPQKHKITDKQEAKLINQSDEALYKAKEDGRNRVKSYYKLNDE